MTVDDLTHQIEETERLIAVYRNANELIAGTEHDPGRRGAAPVRSRHHRLCRPRGQTQDHQ